MSKNIFSVFVLSLLFMLSGCGSNSKPDAVNSVPAKPAAAEMQKNYIVQDTNGTNFTLAIPMTKKLDSTYKVELNAYDLNVKGCVLSMSPNYSPSHLVLNGDEGSIETIYVRGTFDKNCTIEGYIFEANQIVTKDGKKDERKFSAEFDYHSPDGTIPPTKAGYSFYNATTPVTVSQSDTTYEIKVQLLKDGKVYPGGSVMMKPFSSTYGDVSAYSVTTGADGYAKFEYKSPLVLPANGISTSLELLFEDENNKTITQNIVLDFNTSGSGGNNPYSLMNVSTPIEISTANEQKEISVYVVDSTTQVGVEGKTVTITTIENGYGSVSSSTAKTDTSGKAVFHYTAPTSLAGLTSTTAILSFVENGITNQKTITINVNSSNQYDLVNTTTPIEINYDDELKTISVDVVDKNGIGKKNVEVSISAVSGVEYGSIISASTIKSDVSGHAIFTYKAPTDVAAVDGQRTKIELSMVENGIRKTSDVDLTFNKVDLNVSIPFVVISDNYKEINLTQNSQNVQMEVQVFEQGTNIPYTTGNVKVSLPKNVVNGTDVGSFEKYTVPVGSNGKAVFNYTGPQDLQSLIDAGELNATFSFFHENNPTQQENIMVEYDLSAGYIPANYILTTSSSDGDQTMGLKTLKSFTLYLKDDKGNLVSDDDITGITIESQNILIGKLVDAENGGNEVSILTFTDVGAINSKSFSIQTYTMSGLLPIEITVDFNDANGNTKTLTTIMNIVVFSGPPTAMSISYAGVEQNTTIAKYIEKFAVTVTDAYNNPVNTRPYIATGAMVEYAVDGSSPIGERNTTSPRLWHGMKDAHGNIETFSDANVSTNNLVTSSDTFNYVDFSNDKLVIFGSGYVYEALGKWDIEKDPYNPNSELKLLDDYYGSDRSGLFFAVGHNNRQDLCKNDGTEYIGNMKASNYQLDSNGHALIEFEYDYHLTGKDIMVWVNLAGFQADNNTTGRIGEAKKHTLRGNGLMSRESYLVKAGSTGAALHFNIHHENAPEWYRNGHFGFAYKGCKVENIIDSSNRHDARVCTNGAVAYVDLNVSNPSVDDCTISLVDIAVSSEFNGVTYP